MIAGDRVLLPFQSSTAQNGIYIWNGAASAMTRATDAALSSDFYTGFFVYIYAGSTYTGTTWVFTTSVAISLGTTPLAFTGLTGAAGPTGGLGLTGATGAPGPQGPVGVTTNEPPYALIQDQKPQNTAGGTFTTGAWQTRTLNTVVSDVSGLISLVSNQFTLQPGTYRIHAMVTGHACDGHQARLLNVTTGASVLVGKNAFAGSGTAGDSASEISGRFGFASAAAFSIQHQAQTTRATDGFGVAANFTTEVYTSVELWLVAPAPPPPGAQHFAMPNRKPYLTVSHNSQRSNTTLPI